jgi:hypothetical protein
MSRYRRLVRTSAGSRSSCRCGILDAELVVRHDTTKIRHTAAARSINYRVEA